MDTEPVLLTRRPRRRRAPSILTALQTVHGLPAPSVDGDVLTLPQAARLCQVGTGTVLRWVRENGLPCRGEGRIRRFSRAAVLAWLQDG
jgi:excisionase family DNA binding protein